MSQFAHRIGLLIFLPAVSLLSTGQTKLWTVDLRSEGYEQRNFIAVLPGSALHTGIEFSSTGHLLCWFLQHDNNSLVTRNELKSTDPFKIRLVAISGTSGLPTARRDIPIRRQWPSSVFGVGNGVVVSTGPLLTLLSQDLSQDLSEVQIPAAHGFIQSVSRIAGTDFLQIAGRTQERMGKDDHHVFDIVDPVTLSIRRAQSVLSPFKIASSLEVTGYADSQNGIVGFVDENGKPKPLARADLHCAPQLKWVNPGTLLTIACGGFILLQPAGSTSEFHWPEMFNALLLRYTVSADGKRIAFLLLNAITKGKDPLSPYSLHIFELDQRRFTKMIRLPAAKGVIEIALSRNGDRIAVEEDGDLTLFALSD